jgi:dTDP-4-amino-4,6-dideoxygalactose transaminase
VIAANVHEKDLVITTPFSFIASANCILFEKAIPIFVDIDPQTLNIDPGQVMQAIRDLKRGGERALRWLPPSYRNAIDRLGELKAIISVDAFGQPADYDALQKIAAEFDLVLIEDACEALGAEYKGHKAGTLGDIGVFAFYPNKQMTTGEGGMLVTNRDNWNKLFRSLRNQGRDVSDEWLSHTRLGYNYRLDEMSSALGLSQLRRIEDLLAKRELVANLYNQNISQIVEVQEPFISPQTTKMSWFVYVVRVNSREERDLLLEQLKIEGIPSRPYFTPIHLQPFYRDKFGYKRGDFFKTEEAGDTCLALPFSSVMTKEDVNLVCRKIKNILVSRQ